MRTTPITLVLVLICTSPLLAQRAPSNRPQRADTQLPSIEGRYYIIRSPLPHERIREADLRMSKMAEEYHARTKDFAGAIRSKFPFYLYATAEEYLADGGLPGTAGCFDPNTDVLMAFDAGDAELWHTVQHEGFHQFASAVIGGELPIWVNEGLADYFGEALFTGDSFVIGIVPEWRRQRIVKSLAATEGDSAFKSLEALLRLRHADWNDEMSLMNYDQSWSVVHFLVHADGGKYQKAFAAFIRSLGAGRPWETAWQATIGAADGMETRWREFWEQMPANATDDLYAQAVTRTVTNFVSRASSQRQTFASFDAFAKSAMGGEIQLSPRDWLPESVLGSAMEHAGRLRESGYRFALEMPAADSGRISKLPKVVCTAPDGAKYVGQFTLRNGRVAEVLVKTEKPESERSEQNAAVRRRGR